ncbi:MAG: NADH-quinone oxidoreductase subunit H [Aquificota bacterium]|nr:NADH-quinone oxidoreductase subunit H [Aquificota bacterium]
MESVWVDFLVAVIKILVILGIALGLGAYLTWVERKVAAHIQRRPGPMVVGWHGLLQPIADGLKLITKEDLFPQIREQVPLQSGSGYGSRPRHPRLCGYTLRSRV